MPHNTSSLLPGTLDLIVLQLLQAEPTNGYDLTLRIQAVTNDGLNVNAGSLYPALYRLEAKGWISASWELSEKGKRARYYRLTPKGRKQMASEQSKWDTFARAMKLMLKPATEE